MINRVNLPYKVWRVFDIKSLVLNDIPASPLKFEAAPAQLVRVFGPPCYLESIKGTSGTFDFEDNNLSLFKLMDRYEVKEFINPRLLRLRPPQYYSIQKRVHHHQRQTQHRHGLR